MRRKAPIDGWAVLMLVGIPVVLVRLEGWPSPNRIPSRTDVANWVAEPLTDGSITATIAALIWLTWLILLAVAVVEVCRWVTRRRRLPRLQVPQPAQVLTATLMGTAAVSSTAGPVVVDTGGPAATLDDNRFTETSPREATTAVRRAPVTVHVGATSYRYVVKPGDTLSKISRQWLGSPDRWPEICRLNHHRHFPGVGGTLHDCDLIYPGWDLRLPADATPPPSATPARPARPVAPKPDRAVPVDPDGVVEPQPGPTTTASPENAAESTSPPAPTDGEAPAQSSRDQDGIRLPDGSFVPWTLAAAISAAAAMLWLHRRRRYAPTADGTGDEPPALPAPVLELHRQVARNPDLATPTDPGERAAAVPALPKLPTGGLGLVGAGAPAAARAALVAALASGGPGNPDQRGEVVIDTATLHSLCGTDEAIVSWPRLHIADDLDHALSILDARLLHRARVLDEHHLTDLDSLREQAPEEEALPPVLLICQTPPAGARTRARVSFGLGNGLDVSALLLGEWSHGTTIDVTADGHTRVVNGPAVEEIGERVAVLATGEAVAILTTLREAHTGEPPNQVLWAPATPRPAAPAGDPGPVLPAASEPTSSVAETQPQEHQLDTPPPAADSRPHTRVRLRVLGAPTVEDITLPGRDLRGRAAELAVYLACHPDGADTETIAENLVPEFRRRQAKQQVHTNASNLRHVFGRAGEPITGGYVLKRGTNARYRLDPTTVQVDLWQLRDLLTRAQLASKTTRTDLLQEACNIYTAPLADGCDYEWVETHRETARRWGTEAHLLLADDLLESDPQAASDLLDKAIGLDRYNEQLYRTAMHARHALGDADGIRALLRALTKALADLDAEPAQATTELAAKLRASLEQR